jgi:SAM-dependent methyltransferase
VTELDGVADHYERLLRAHGATSRGADFRDDASQGLRFERLDRLVLGCRSVCDLGCGYGAYLDHLRTIGWSGEYVGIDVTPGMIDAARAAHPDYDGGRFEVGSRPERAEAVVASGIFNVRFGDDETWRAHVRSTIDAMREAATVGVAFNVLSRAVSPHLFSMTAAELASWLPPGATVEEDVGTADLTAFVLR